MFKGKNINVIDGINLEIEKGQIYIIYGRSGIGKTTLVSLLGGLDRVTSGSISFKERHYEKMSNEELALLRRNSIGVISQKHNLISSWTSIENVIAPLVHTKITKQERIKKAKSLLESFDLGDRLFNMPSKLSSGQEQRVAIARTLMSDLELIIADEPTGDVDRETAKDIIRLMYQPVLVKGVSLLIVTKGDFLNHLKYCFDRFSEEFPDLVHKIYILSNGKIEHYTAFSSKDDFLKRSDIYEGLF